MAGTKFSALPAAASALGTHEFAVNEGNNSKKLTGALLRSTLPLNNASTGNQTGFAADTYLAGSTITVPAGAWLAGTICKWQFDMAKTAAGVAQFLVSIRLGTNGNTGDTAMIVPAFAAGTAAADTGVFDVTVVFRSVGGGTSALMQAMVRCTHLLAATGLISTGASGVGIIIAGSANFDSTTQTKIGLSVNGGAAFSGTNTYVIAEASKL